MPGQSACERACKFGHYLNLLFVKGGMLRFAICVRNRMVLQSGTMCGTTKWDQCEKCGMEGHKLASWFYKAIQRAQPSTPSERATKNWDESAFCFTCSVWQLMQRFSRGLLGRTRPYILVFFRGWGEGFFTFLAFSRSRLGFNSSDFRPFSQLFQGWDFCPCFLKLRMRGGILPYSSAISRSGREPWEPLN